MASSPNAQPLRLLLVDDEVGFVNVLAKRLTMRGNHVTVALTGDEGIQAMVEYEFDVAILDLKLKDLNGIEVLKAFKEINPKVAVIMLTGHGSEKYLHSGLETGAFAYLTKPCDLGELIEMISEAAKSRHSAD